MEAHVLIVEDDVPLRDALAETLGLAGLDVVTAGDGEEALAVLREERPRLVVSDIQMRPMDGMAFLKAVRAAAPDTPVLLMTAYATVQQAVEAMKMGAVDYLVKPFEGEVLVSKVVSHLPAETAATGDPVAEDPVSRDLLALAARVGGSEATVMISGESGTGKEVYARYLHAHSPRAGGPFVAINCAAIPENMLEAVLFGYEKGAFTGAYKAAPGKFEQAHGGTLLLDEVSEMPLGLQAKLLRVLQEREVERLGSQRMIPLDVRVLATSNRDMAELVREGTFREDLYYRLNVFPLHIPPLRERPGDIVALAAHLLRLHGGTGETPRLGEAARDALVAYHWPGNVRELANVIQRALILNGSGDIDLHDLHFQAPRPQHPAALAPAMEQDAETPLGMDLRDKERELIMDALQRGNGSKKNAAKLLGISPRTLRYKLQKLREAGMAVAE
ncbi:MAG: sigma-54 dependent transcriptional regulator [Gammaproteobacteria bacterium]|nr:sigma-54 dependent transcriptional regulator [Gammaproteobacteria bacterium]